MRRGTVLAAGLLLVGVAGVSGCGTAAHPQGQVTVPSACAGQREAVRRALDQSQLRVDVTGDGKPDTVAVASDATAPKPCRALVAVRAHGAGYSAHLVPAAVPAKGARARIEAVPRLGRHSGATIIVDTDAMVDAVRAQLFTVSDGRLHAVSVPGEPDGSFLVEGGGVLYPHAAGCTADGRLIVSHAAQTQHGRRFTVTRHVYELDRAGLNLNAVAVQRTTIPLRRLGQRFPEFTRAHWQACTHRPAR